jgi:hypothetical protein
MRLMTLATVIKRRARRPHLGSLYASIAFDPTTSRSYANFLLRLADRLTYRELACVAFLASQRNRAALVDVDLARSEGGVSSTEPITAELTELGQAGVIGVRQDDGRVAPPYAVSGGGDLRGLPLAKLQPTTVGDDLYRLMRLNEVATVAPRGCHSVPPARVPSLH